MSDNVEKGATSISIDTVTMLVCSSCKKIPMKKGLFQCHNGHMICQKCWPDVEACPKCGIGYKKDEAISAPQVVDALMDQIPLMCAFQRHGCTEPVMRREALKVHMEICQFRTTMTMAIIKEGPASESSSNQTMKEMNQSSEATNNTMDSDLCPISKRSNDDEDKKDEGEPGSGEPENPISAIGGSESGMVEDRGTLVGGSKLKLIKDPTFIYHSMVDMAEDADCEYSESEGDENPNSSKGDSDSEGDGYGFSAGESDSVGLKDSDSTAKDEKPEIEDYGTTSESFDNIGVAASVSAAKDIRESKIDNTSDDTKRKTSGDEESPAKRRKTRRNATSTITAAVVENVSANSDSSSASKRPSSKFFCGGLGDREWPHCDDCDKNFVDKAGLNKHRRSVHNDGAKASVKVFACSLCGENHPYKTKLAVHITSKHCERKNETGKSGYFCPYCDKSLSKTGAPKHIMTHL